MLNLQDINRKLYNKKIVYYYEIAIYVRRFFELSRSFSSPSALFPPLREYNFFKKAHIN